jgi:hypothetical protein
LQRPLDRPLLESLPPELHKAAVEVSHQLMSYITKEGKDQLAEVQIVLGKGVTNEGLRDEIYCQVLKCCVKYPNRYACHSFSRVCVLCSRVTQQRRCSELGARCWEWMSYVVATFLPSPELRKITASFLFANKNRPDDPIASVCAGQSLRLLERASYRADRRGCYRYAVPSILELQALKVSLVLFYPSLGYLSLTKYYALCRTECRSSCSCS